MNKTSIAWCDRTWNPVRGCSRISAGCGGPGNVGGCYAEAFAARFSYPEELTEPDPITGVRELKTPAGHWHGFAERTPAGPRWTGKVELLPEKLNEPLRLRKPQRIFVNSTSDLFHERLSNEAIAAVFGVMAAAPQHTFQVLTKRAERMRTWFQWIDQEKGARRLGLILMHAQRHVRYPTSKVLAYTDPVLSRPWPLPNVWLGVSVEDQKTADERIPLLLQTPAAVRWVSYEPALGPVDFTHVRPVPGGWINALDGKYRIVGTNATQRAVIRIDTPNTGALDWVIVGGESGPHARPFDLAWARSVRDQCRAAGVAFFMKQLGSQPRIKMGSEPFYSMVVPAEPGLVCPVMVDRAGAWPAEWPEDLRAQEFPK